MDGELDMSARCLVYKNNRVPFNEEYKKLICIGALIHDLGHGPFSHLFDELTNSNHEQRSIELFKFMNQKYKLNYSDTQIEFISNVIIPTNNYINKFNESRKEEGYTFYGTSSYMFDIVSNKNGIDVDRMDYIMRDIKATGLNYGIDYETIMNNSLISKSGIIYSQKSYDVIENFYKTRNILYKDIYNHKTVRLLEHMIKEIIINSSKLINIKEIINDNKWEEFINLNDYIIDEINNSENNDKSKEIINKIKKRDLYKLYGEIQLNYKIDDLNDKEGMNNKEGIIIDESVISYYNHIKPIYWNNTKLYTNIIKNKEEKVYIYKFYYNSNSYNDIQNIYDMIINKIN